MHSNQHVSAESESLSTTLLEQVRAHQPLAWERLVRLYSPLIYRWCRRSGVQPEDAADLLRDVFTAVLLHLPDFRRGLPGDSFTAWLATTPGTGSVTFFVAASGGCRREEEARRTQP